MVTGNRWGKDEQVSISVADNIDGDNARQVARTKADDKGAIKVTVTLKESLPNPLYIVASGKSGTVIVRAQLGDKPTSTPTPQPIGEPTLTATAME